MCGIAGYSLSPDSRVDRTLAAQALLAAIAERGADAVGYGWRAQDGAVEMRKRRSGASELLDSVSRAGRRDAGARARARLHEGPPADRGEQPPDPARRRRRRPQRDHRQRRGALRRARVRARGAGMTVDSEAIFALVEQCRRRARVLEQLRGSMATAWLDERAVRPLFLARSVGRPLWLGTAAARSSSPRPATRSRSSRRRCG